MKPTFAMNKHLHFAALLGAALLAWIPAGNAPAQTIPSLGMQPYTGISVTGVVGRVYQVQYATVMSPTATWYALQHFELKWNPHRFVDNTTPATGQRYYRVVEVDVPTNITPVANMLFVPPGTFTMGSPPDEPGRWFDEGPQTTVTISHPFWMGKFEVTQGEFVSIMNTNTSYQRNGGFWYLQFGGVGGPVTNEVLHPIDACTWFEATNYCHTLTMQERAAGRIPPGWAYRLPWEAEWEYACRAGTTTAFHYGPALRSGMANFRGTEEQPPCGEEEDCINPLGIFLGRSCEVGRYEPNNWGFYDMHANLFEWCLDYWSPSLPGGSVIDPKGTVPSTGRLIRSGRWYSSARRARSATRLGYGTPETLRSDDVGFRVILTPVDP